MQAIRFLSKFVFICNICFVLFALFAILETTTSADNLPDIVHRFSFIKDLIITLGFLAIIFNLILCITYLGLLAFKRNIATTPALALTNAVFLVIQILYFFIFN